MERKSNNLYLSSNEKNLTLEFNSGWLSANSNSCDELMALIKGLGFKVHSKNSIQEIFSLKNTSAYSTQYFLF